MAYNGKTNWVNNEIVEAVDMNRIEQGITDLEELISGQLDNSHNTDANAHDDIREQLNDLDANKVDNSRVLTDVPSNAVFTDTVTTINGKTGAIAKADIVALGIPAQDTNTTYSDATTSTAGLMSAADKTKLDGVATGANNYTHPTTAGNKHIPSGGDSGNLLGYSASGTAQWVAPSTINAGQVDGKSVWVGAEGDKGTDANTIYFCY